MGLVSYDKSIREVLTDSTLERRSRIYLQKNFNHESKKFSKNSHESPINNVNFMLGQLKDSITV